MHEYTLKEFMELDVYKNADCVEYLGADLNEITYDPCSVHMLNAKVIKYNCASGGYLEIQLMLD